MDSTCAMQDLLLNMRSLNKPGTVYAFLEAIHLVLACIIVSPIIIMKAALVAPNSQIIDRKINNVEDTLVANSYMNGRAIVFSRFSQS